MVTKNKIVLSLQNINARDFLLLLIENYIIIKRNN